jgi:hypothetical protein
MAACNRESKHEPGASLSAFGSKNNYRFLYLSG